MTRIDGDWLRAPETQKVLCLLEDGGAQALLVGGCVRNALLGVPVRDIDIATDRRPEAVIALAESAGVRAVPTGLAHGTVTLVEGGRPFEVTTFRRDVATDGRHAIVAHSERIEEDAARRDFTMNGLYALRTGEVIDPLGGLSDLLARRVRFIGDASARIREDHLRSLRYFRFHALYGDPENGFDAEALAAIAGGLDGVKTLSRERVGAEMLKLLGAHDPAPSIAVMAQIGLLAVCLPGAVPDRLAPLVALEAAAGARPDALRRLAALGTEEPGKALRLSKAEAKTVDLLRLSVAGDARPAELAYRHGERIARDAILLRLAGKQPDWPAETDREIARGAAARFPLTARDLMPDYSGPDLGARLKELEKRWIASGFTLGRDALLAG